MNKHGLSIPCHWNLRVMGEMLQRPVSKGDLPIVEVYGTLPRSPLMHGRASSTVSAVTRGEAIIFLRLLRDFDVAFTYLLNAPYFPEKHNRREEMKKYLEWVLGDLCPDALTIASLTLMQLVREMDQNIPIHVSTIAGVRCAQDLERFLNVNPNRVVPHHDLGKDWRALDEVAICAEKNGMEVELLVTESCVFSCPIRDAHYGHLALESTITDVFFHNTCRCWKEKSPGEYLRAGGATRPEDVSMLEQLGVDLFKISGRDRPAEEMPEIVSAYQKRRYKGNFFWLMDVAPSVRDEYPYLENSALDGFLANLPQGSEEKQKTYCNEWAFRLNF